MRTHWQADIDCGGTGQDTTTESVTQDVGEAETTEVESTSTGVVAETTAELVDTTEAAEETSTAEDVASNAVVDTSTAPATVEAEGGWSESQILQMTVDGDAKQCYMGIFGGDLCTSDGALTRTFSSALRSSLAPGSLWALG